MKCKKAKELDALEFKQYVDEGYLVYLFAPRVINLDKIENVVSIGDNDLLDFYKKYKLILTDLNYSNVYKILIQIL